MAWAARVPTLRNHWRPSTGGHLDRDDQLVGAHDGLPVARVERGEGHAALAVHAAEKDRGLGHRQDGQRVAGRRGVGDVAAQRAAVLDLRAADPPRGLGQDRQPAAHERRRDQLRVRGQGADHERLAAQTDPAEGSQALQIEEPRLAHGPEVQADVEIGAPGERHERALVAQHPQRGVERPGLEKREAGEGRWPWLLAPARRRRALPTARPRVAWSLPPPRDRGARGPDPRAAAPPEGRPAPARCRRSRCTGRGCRRGPRERARRRGGGRGPPPPSRCPACRCRTASRPRARGPRAPGCAAPRSSSPSARARGRAGRGRS